MISQLFHVVLLQRVSSMTLLNSGRKEQVELPIPKLISSSKTLPGALTFNTSLPTWNKSQPVRELTIKTFNGWIWLMVSFFIDNSYFCRTLHCLDENSRSSKLQKALGKNWWKTSSWKVHVENHQQLWGQTFPRLEIVCYLDHQCSWR